MMTVPDELLMAYADGELTSDEAGALEQLLRQDAGLRARLEPFVETRIRISYVFEEKLHEPVPDRLIAAIARASVGNTQSRQAPSRPPLHERLRERLRDAWAAAFPGGFTSGVAAASAVLAVAGLAIGWVGGRVSAPSGLIEVAGPQLIASGSLAQALESSPSGVAIDAHAGGASVLPVLSFRTQGNGLCREYRVTGAGSGRDFAGLACRAEDGTWHVALHAETPGAPADRGPYQTATSSKVAAVDALTETLIKGDAFGRDEEAMLLGNGWQESGVPRR